MLSSVLTLSAKITEFLNKPEVMEDLGVKRKWEACRKIEELLVSC